MRKLRWISVRLFLFLVLFLGTNCEKDNCDVIPNVRVDFNVNLFTPPFDQLQAIGNSVAVPTSISQYSGGYNGNGVILYRKVEDEFNAFDRTCTYAHETPIAIEIDKDNPFKAICPECGSEFFISAGGVPSEGSAANCPLKEYNADYFIAIQEVRVYNF
jgi:nitrite reductase/ring-hydroxylating ferredoxin subunit